MIKATFFLDRTCQTCVDADQPRDSENCADCIEAFRPDDPPLWRKKATMNPWIQTYTSQAFDLLDPQIDQVCIEDIAHALSQICRYTGHTKWFYSVAQHCVVMSYLVPPEHALWALLHDAPEAYVNDLAAPIKQLPNMDGYRHLEGRVESVVCAALGYWPTDESRAAIKAADLRMLMTEARQLLPWPPPRDWGFDVEPYDLEGYDIGTWSPSAAKSAYLDRYRQLMIEIRR